MITGTYQVAVIKPISGCVLIACSGLMITSLLQLDCQDFLSTSLMQVVSTKACKYQVAANLVFTDLLQLDEVNRLATTC